MDGMALRAPVGDLLGRRSCIVGLIGVANGWRLRPRPPSARRSSAPGERGYPNLL
jgi:hypothetical protein